MQSGTSTLILSNIHKDEMIIPAKESAVMRDLFNKSTSGRMQGTDVFNSIGNKNGSTTTQKINNITITQTFIGKQAPIAGPQMKNVASELASQLAIQGN